MKLKGISTLVCAILFSCARQGKLEIVNRSGIDVYYKIVFEPDNQRLTKPHKSPMLSKLENERSVAWDFELVKYQKGMLHLKLFRLDSVSSKIEYIRDQIVPFDSLLGDSARPIIIDKL